MRKRLEIGTKRNGLTFVRRISIKVIECKCVCGEVTSILQNHFGRNVSCGCAKHKRGKDHHAFKGLEELYGGHFNSIKIGAKNRSLEFNITIEYIWDLFLKQNRKCALTNIDLEFEKSGSLKSWTASLDRIDSKKGYIIGNVHWVHKDINRMKQEFSLKYFKELCKLVTLKDNE